jgi:dTDP-4-dehydrorhamnose 3,5-epimerase-like enzyme
MSRETIHLWALVWNEIRILPYFLKHYRPFVDRFYLYDDGSDDGSAEYLAAQPDVVLRRFSNDGSSFVAAAQRFNNHAWKESRESADWVILTNVDELLYHPQLRRLLEDSHQHHVTLFPSRGWEMVTADFPTEGPLVRSANCGVPSKALSKISIFDPIAIEETNFSPGRHNAGLVGRLGRHRQPQIDLLHYKHLGEDYLVQRYRELGARMKPGDVAARLGTHYSLAETKLRAKHRRLLAGAQPVLIADRVKAGLISRPSEGVVLSRLPVSETSGVGHTAIWRGDDGAATPIQQIDLTTLPPGTVQAWLRHHKQTTQVAPVRGRTRTVLWDPARPDAPPIDILLDSSSPQLLRIGPGLWYGFKACGDEPSTLMHLSDNPRDWSEPDEEKLEATSDRIPYRWAAPCPTS